MEHIYVGDRFLDAGKEPSQHLMPLEGYEQKPLLILEDAVKPIQEFLKNLDPKVQIALRNSRQPEDDLYVDESASIHLYTMEWRGNESSLYTELNKNLRSTDRKTLKPWFSYLKLFLTALYKLPSFKGVIWRGVRDDLRKQYVDDCIWWGVSSCTGAIEVMKNFLGPVGPRTLFNIECINGKSVKKHSFSQAENEIILMPGTYLKVLGKWSPSSDFHIIHLREETPPYQTIVPPYNISLPLESKIFSALSLYAKHSFSLNDLLSDVHRYLLLRMDTIIQAENRIERLIFSVASLGNSIDKNG
jgi:hypothetical protein